MLENDLFINNRSESECFSFLGLSEEEVLGLPEGALMIEAGSGITMNLVRAVRSLNPGVRLVAVDPTLGLGYPENGQTDYEAVPAIEDIKCISYFHNSTMVNTKDGRYFYVNPKELQLARREYVAAVAPDVTVESDYLPNQRFQVKYWGQTALYLDLYSAYYYSWQQNLTGPGGYTPETLQPYLSFVYSLLAPGGKALIAPAHLAAAALSNSFLSEFPHGEEADFTRTQAEITETLWRLKTPMQCRLGWYEDRTMDNSVWLRLEKLDRWS